MIKLSMESRILLAVKPVDFRKGIDGLCSVVRNQFKQQPRSGDVFGFQNRSKTMMRFLVYDGTGFWVMTKRLSEGKFRYWPKSKDTEISVIAAKHITTMIKGAKPLLED